MDKREQWIDEVVQTAKGIGPVASNPYLATRIEGKLQQQSMPQISVRWVYATIAAMAIILFINISVWRSADKANDQNPAIEQLVQEYGWSNADIYSNAN
jgi:hypothetical protein